MLSLSLTVITFAHLMICSDKGCYDSQDTLTLYGDTYLVNAQNYE